MSRWSEASEQLLALVEQLDSLVDKLEEPRPSTKEAWDSIIEVRAAARYLFSAGASAEAAGRLES